MIYEVFDKKGSVVVIKGLSPNDAFSKAGDIEEVINKRWICVGPNEFLPDPTDNKHNESLVKACEVMPAKFIQGMDIEEIPGVKMFAVPKTAFNWDQVSEMLKKGGISKSILDDAITIPDNLEVGIDEIKAGVSVEEMVTGLKPIPKKKTLLQKLFKFLPR